MGLQFFEYIRAPVLYDLPCKKHAAGLSSDHSGTYHPLTDNKVILRLKVGLYHLPHPQIPGHHDITYPGTLFSNVHSVLKHGFGHIEKPVPAVHVSPVR